MANFNEKINSHQEFVLRDQKCDYFIERLGSMERLKLEFDYISHFLDSNYRLFIQYKCTHCLQKLAGRCFMWSCTSNARGGGDVRNLCLDRDGNEDLDNFGNPKFDYIAGAVLITDKYVLTYGDTWFEAVDLEEKHVVCKAYVCGRFVSEFRIPAETFDSLFGLNENFPEQYEKVFGKTQDAKPVQEENDLIEESKRNVELCKNLLYSTKQMIERAVDLMQGAIIEIEDRSDQAVELIQGALIDIEDRKRELDDMLYKLTPKEARREERR